MGDIVDLDTWRQCSDIEKDYLNFLTHVNKYIKPPMSMPDLIRSFYFITRYLEGTVNSLDILSLVKPLPQNELDKLREHVISKLDEIKESLMKY